MATYNCQICGETVDVTDQPTHFTERHLTVTETRAMRYEELVSRARRMAKDAGRIWAVMSPEDKIRFLDRVRSDGNIYFPSWVFSPTPCKTQTNSVTWAQDDMLFPHGALKVIVTRVVR